MSDDAYGYSVWIAEDPKVTVEALKSKAGATLKKTAIVSEDDKGIIVLVVAKLAPPLSLVP